MSFNLLWAASNLVGLNVGKWTQNLATFGRKICYFVTFLLAYYRI